MEHLVEIAKFVTRNRLKKIDMLSSTAANRGNRYLVVTDSLAKGGVSTENEMAELIGIEERSNHFRVFKTRLFDKLLNSLLFLDLDESKFPPYSKAILVCNRNLYCVRVLLVLNARQSAAYIAAKTIDKALKYELTDTVLFCARYLRTHHSLLGDLKNFDFYDKLVKQYHAILNAEDTAAEYLEKINVIGVNSNTSRKEYVEIAKNYLVNVTELFQIFPTYQISLNIYRIKGLTEFLQKDYVSAINTWKEFDVLIEKYKHFEYDNRIAESELNKMGCYLYLRDYDNGAKCALNCDKLYTVFSNNWFVFKESFLLLAFHTGKYEQAAETIDLVATNEKFRRLIPNRQEIWIIFEAYLHLLYKGGLAKPKDTNKKKNRFRLSSFLNSTPIYSKDKSGYNVLIFMIQILQLFIEKNYFSLYDKINALEKYDYRYLEKDRDYRTIIFIKMIIEVKRAEFDLDQTQKRTSSLYSKLHDTQVTHVTGLEGLEIVPFDVLWKIILRSLS